MLAGEGNFMVNKQFKTNIFWLAKPQWLMKAQSRYGGFSASHSQRCWWCTKMSRYIKVWSLCKPQPKKKLKLFDWFGCPCLLKWISFMVVISKCLFWMTALFQAFLSSFKSRAFRQHLSCQSWDMCIDLCPRFNRPSLQIIGKFLHCTWNCSHMKTCWFVTNDIRMRANSPSFHMAAISCTRCTYIF